MMSHMVSVSFSSKMAHTTTALLLMDLRMETVDTSSVEEATMRDRCGIMWLRERGSLLTIRRITRI